MLAKILIVASPVVGIVVGVVLLIERFKRGDLGFFGWNYSRTTMVTLAAFAAYVALLAVSIHYDW